MVKEDLKKRIKSCGVKLQDLERAVECGAYRNLEEALNALDLRRPLGNKPQHRVALSRMMMINNNIIDRNLFNLAKSTTAWTHLEDYQLVFVLIGPAERGFILHERITSSVPFELRWQGGSRFLRFQGDVTKERKKKKGAKSLFQLLSGKMHLPVRDARDIFEQLVRTCDENGWEHVELPFIWKGRTMDAPKRLLHRHGLLVHCPVSVTLPKAHLQ